MNDATGADHDERELVEAVLRAAPGAFERLVERYQNLCWHIVLRMVRHPEDARELCQETFLRVHSCLHQYRFESPLKSWIGQVAYSLARRHLQRKRIPLVEHGHADDDGSPLDRIGADDDVEAAHIDAEMAERLHQRIDALPPMQRTMITLFYLDELPIAEIARITGLADGTIKSHLFRARRQLQVAMATPAGAER